MRRRVFLRSGALAMVSMGVAPGFLWRVAGAAPRSKKTLVCIFQRGAVDGLSALIPHAEPAYFRARPRIGIPRSGDRRTTVIDLDGFFGFHPALRSLKPLYDRGTLAGVHAVGSPSATRSHFDAQYFMETAAPDSRSVSDGWLNRAMSANPSSVNPGSDSGGHRYLRAVAIAERLPVSLKGEASALALRDLEAFLSGPPGGLDTFSALYDEESEDLILGGPGREAAEAVRLLRANDPRRYRPGADYPRSRFARSLLQVAQMIKANVGLEIAFVDIGGWDTHVNQGGAEGQLALRFRDFADSIAAFCHDLEDRLDDVVILTMSEFGRTVRENGNAGTDHGHATCLFVIGGPVSGGRIYGDWPGLETEQLHEGRDLTLTTDFRQIFAELLAGHLGMTQLESAFPGFAASRSSFLGLIG